MKITMKSKLVPPPPVTLNGIRVTGLNPRPTMIVREEVSAAYETEPQEEKEEQKGQNQATPHENNLPLLLALTLIA